MTTKLGNMKSFFNAVPLKRVNGGWVRQVNQKDFPVAKQTAGVLMHLNPGGVRELHWHTASEWAFMLKGTTRITCFNPNGQNFVNDVVPGDLWFFPAGYPHSIQGLSEGAEFLLVFDRGDFSEDDTFSITDWFAHTPRDVLSANFGVPQSIFAHIAPGEKYAFQGVVPGPLVNDMIPSPAGSENFSSHMLAQRPFQGSGGTVRISDCRTFPVTTTSASYQRVVPGGLREMHWHVNSDEWQYYIQGTARMTVFAAQGMARTFHYKAGDIGYVPKNMGHYVQNTGNEDLVVLEVFRSPLFSETSLDQWLALTPPELVMANLNVGPEFISVLKKTAPLVVKYPHR